MEKYSAPGMPASFISHPKSTEQNFRALSITSTGTSKYTIVGIIISFDQNIHELKKTGI
jgi:hypothetical protein